MIKARFIKLSSEYAANPTKVTTMDKLIRYGDKNDFPYYLQDLLRKSGLHRAIIERKVNMLIGRGIYDDNGDEILDRPNQFETYEELIQKLAYDLETFGGYYLQVIQKRGNGIAEIYHMPFERMRVGLPNGYGVIEDFYYWKDLTSPITSYNDVSKFVHFKAYGTNGKEPKILFVKSYSTTNPYYGSPIYEGALLDIQTYAEISNFNNSNLHNSFAPSFLVFFRGPEPDEDVQDAIVSQFQEKYKGSENTGKPMIFFLDTDSEAPQIETIDISNLAEQYDQLIKTIKENIVISHQIPRQVVGLESAGSLGNSKEILQASQMFRTDYIEPHQQLLLRGINMVRSINNQPFIKINNPNPSIIAYDIEELLKFLDVNEVREIFGYQDNSETNMGDTTDDK